MRPIFLLSRALFLIAAALVSAQARADASLPVGDGVGNHYRISVDAGAHTAHVQADLWLPSPSLAMFGVDPTPEFANGQADFIDDLRVTDGAGQAVTVKPLGEGDYELAATGRLHLDYRVRLEHDRYAWPAGVEEVSYHTDEGLMITGYALLLAPGDGMVGPIDVAFSLPQGWQAITPWQPAGDGRYSVASRRELLSNALFLGTAPAETLDVGGVQLTLVLGPRYRAQRDLFVDLLAKQMRRYREFFGAAPLSSRYLVIVNEGKDDGGAFASSFSQLIGGDATAENRLGWGFVMSHELLHFWNGLALVPADAREEWFKEGATDYLTLVAQAQNGLLDENRFHWRLENIARRYLFGRVGQRLGMSVREAGKDKQPNRELVYGGGALAAFALDVELRKASDNRLGLPDLMRSLYLEFGAPGQTYSLADIERHAQALVGRDLHPVLARWVEGTDLADARPVFEDAGLLLNNYLFDESYVRPNPHATAGQRARFAAMFGRR